MASSRASQRAIPTCFASGPEFAALSKWMFVSLIFGSDDVNRCIKRLYSNTSNSRRHTEQRATLECTIFWSQMHTTKTTCLPSSRSTFRDSSVSSSATQWSSASCVSRGTSKLIVNRNKSGKSAGLLSCTEWKRSRTPRRRQAVCASRKVSCLCCRRRTPHCRLRVQKSQRASESGW